MTAEKSTHKSEPKKGASTKVEKPKKATKAASIAAESTPVAPVAKQKPRKTAASATTKSSAKPKAEKKAANAEPKETKATKASKPRAAKKKPAAMTKDELQHLIAVAAYHKAEKRGFAPGYELQDWIDAEAEIYAMLGLSQA